MSSCNFMHDIKGELARIRTIPKEGTPLPEFQGWARDEWHRSILLAHRGTSSFNQHMILTRLKYS